jgi:hypothetical protein
MSIFITTHIYMSISCKKIKKIVWLHLILLSWYFQILENI